MPTLTPQTLEQMNNRFNFDNSQLAMKKNNCTTLPVQLEVNSFYKKQAI